MSVEVHAKIRIAVPLTEILSHMESSISALLRTPLALRAVVEDLNGSLADMVIGPYPHEEGRAPAAVRHMRIKPFSSWNRDDLTIRLGEDAAVDLAVHHSASNEELGISMAGMTDEEREAHLMVAGYRAAILVWRTRASVCLATFLAASIATLNDTMVIDSCFFPIPTPVAPGTLLAMLARHRDAASFEELAERFCDAIGLRFGA